jgi:hypothetical protein
MKVLRVTRRCQLLDMDMLHANVTEGQISWSLSHHATKACQVAATYDYLQNFHYSASCCPAIQTLQIIDPLQNH